MVLSKSSTSACILIIVFLCGAWLSSARLHHAGAQIDGIWNTKASTSVATTTVNNNKEKRLEVIDGISSKKLSVNWATRKIGNPSSSKPSSSVEGKRSLNRTRISDGFVAFTADYHSPKHHPPKNNK